MVERIVESFHPLRVILFGSHARGDAKVDSDIDLLVSFGRPVSLFQQMNVAEALTRVCGRQVDLVTRLDPAFAPYIPPTLIPLPV